MQIEIPDELAAAVAEIAAKTGQDVRSLIVEMVTEAIKMRRVPGILFADGPTGRRARIGGTGIEVFEVIDRYEGVGRDRLRLQELFHWLEPHQIGMAPHRVGLVGGLFYGLSLGLGGLMAAALGLLADQIGIIAVFKL